jgi:hypothetical protein
MTMTHDEKPLFGLSLQPLGIIFKTEVTDLLIKAYWEDLHDLPLAAFQAACRQARRHEKFFPVPAVLREYAGPYTDRPDPPDLLALTDSDATERQRAIDRTVALADLENKIASMSPAQQARIRAFEEERHYGKA